MTKDKDAWTPYGLEHIRHRHVVRRRILGILILLLLLGLLYAFFGSTTTRQTDIFANGNRVNGGNGISIQQQDDGPKKDHVTVGIEPGKVTRAEAGNDAGAASIQRSSVPTFSRAAPLNWGAYLMLYGPYVLLGLAMWYLAKRRGKHDELNYGVYKGALPLELITASHHGEVFTKEHVKGSIFGKKRLDHLPRDIATVEMASVEEEG